MDTRSSLNLQVDRVVFNWVSVRLPSARRISYVKSGFVRVDILLSPKSYNEESIHVGPRGTNQGDEDRRLHSSDSLHETVHAADVCILRVPRANRVFTVRRGGIR